MINRVKTVVVEARFKILSCFEFYAVPTTSCNPNPCLNGGTCTEVGTSYTCACLPAWAGDQCGGK